MTATANLSVGLNTAAARQALLELKQFMGESVRNVAVSIDPMSIDRQIAGYFKQRTFKFRVDASSTKNIANEIENEVGVGLARAFRASGAERQVRWNRDQFYGSLKSALDGQFGNRTRRLEYNRDAFRASVQEDLAAAFANPQVVKVKADVTATSTGGPLGAGARQVEMAQIASTINSALTPAIDELAKAAVTVGGVARQIGVTGSKEKPKATMGGSVIDPATGLRTSIRLPVENAETAIKEVRKNLAQGMRAGSAPLLSPETLLGLPSRDQTKTMGAQIAAQMRDGVAQEALRAKSASKLDARALLGLPSRAEARSMGEQIVAQMRERMVEEQAQIRRFFNNQRAQFQQQFSGQGPSIAAAQATAARFGRGPTEEILGNRAFLLDQVGTLENLRVKTEGVQKAHLNWASAIREVHSGVRGLMGPLGMMWLTWGSIVPLLAGAAVAQSLRTIVSVGKELEYQLKFVQVLSNGAAVSIDEFNSVVAGSVVGPTEAANALRGLAQNGLNAKQALMALPDILRLATVGEMDLASAALGATGVMEAFNLRFYDLGRVGDVFASAAASSNTSVAQMVEAMKQASTVADQYKLTIEEVAASLAVLAQRNITGSAAGTAFRNMMSDLTAPTEKAKTALQAIGVSIFDNNKQVKPYMTILQELKTATSSLNEESRKAVFGAIFDERGQKAAENLLNNFGDLKERITDLTNSTGFMQQVVSSLGDTTEGKIRRLSSSFQLVSAEVFNSSEGVKNLVDQLRVMVASDGFQSALQGIAEVTLNVTRFMTENVAVLVSTALAWGALRIAVSLGSAAYATFVPVATAVNAALAAIGVSARVAAVGMGLMTGGLGLVALIAAEYFLLSRNTSAASEAAEAYENQVKLMKEEVVRSTKELREKNAVVEEEIRLMYAGVDAAEAKRRAEQKQSQGPLRERESLLKSQLVQAQAMAVSSNPAERSKGVRDELRLQNELKKVVADIQSMELESHLRYKEDVSGRASSERAEVIRQAQGINSKIRDAGKSLKSPVSMIDVASMQGMSIEEAKRLVADTREKFNQAARSVKIGDDPKATSFARSLIDGVTGDVRDMKAEFDQRTRLLEQLKEAQLGSINMGPALAAELAVQRARERGTATVEIYARMMERLQQAKGTPGLQDNDRQRLDNDIDRLRAEMALKTQSLDLEVMIAQAKRDSAKADREAASRRDLAGIQSQVDEQIRKRQQKGDLKVVDAVEAARAEASSAAVAQYTKSIADQEALIEEQRRASLSLKGDELQAALAQIRIEQEILALYREQARLSGKKAGDAAAAVQSDTMSAEYGMKRFWVEYRNEAKSAADQVHEIMKFSVSGLEQMMTEFRTTGKMNFRDFATSVIMEITRIMTSRAISDFASFLMKTIGGAGSGGVNLGTVTGLDMDLFFADGGVMTGRGPIPLRRFADGGIGRSPMVAVHSEWTKPEAYVPLPDGRTIPVTMSGGQQGGGVNLTYAPQIHVDARTDREEVIRAVDDRIQAGNQALVQHLKDTRVIA